MEKYTTEVLSSAFDKVKNKKHWKNPINIIVSILDESELDIFYDAIVFYTGSVPHFGPIKNNKVRIRADGYYAVIGA